MNNLQKLALLGQSIWYDNISRGVILRGELKKMVDEGLLGITSNPTIFDKAISGSNDYDDQIRELVSVRDMTPEDLVLLKRVVENAKAYFRDPERYKRAVQPISEDDHEE